MSTSMIEAQVTHDEYYKRPEPEPEPETEPETRVTSLSLGGYVEWECRIDLGSSESSTCSSPTSEASNFDYTLDNDVNDEAESKDGIEVDAPLPPPTLMEQMVSALPAVGERPILEHLFWNPVTLADVEVLVPALLKNWDIMDQLVVNIGYFSAYGLIPPLNLEPILLRLFAAGDDHYYLYETTKARIELERRRREHLEHVERNKRVKHRGKTDTIISNSQHCETIGDFSRSRLHNGPGLTDRKYPKARLPQNDPRQASAMPNRLVLELNTKVKHDVLYARIRPSPEFAFGERKEEIVVRLPPKNLGLWRRFLSMLLQPRSWTGPPLYFCQTIRKSNMDGII